jgi:hypothetical protein
MVISLIRGFDHLKILQSCPIFLAYDGRKSTILESACIEYSTQIRKQVLQDNMYLREHVRRIFVIVAELSKRDSDAGIMYMTICRHAPDLPMSGVLEHLNELCSYGLIRRGEGRGKVAGAQFDSIYYITKYGIEVSNQDQKTKP